MSDVRPPNVVRPETTEEDVTPVGVVSTGRPERAVVVEVPDGVPALIPIPPRRPTSPRETEDRSRTESDWTDQQTQ